MFSRVINACSKILIYLEQVALCSDFPDPGKIHGFVMIMGRPKDP